MKDKVGNFSNSTSGISNGISEQVEMGLQGLGYTSKESKEVVSQIREQIEDSNMDLPTAIKLALQAKGNSKK